MKKKRKLSICILLASCILIGTVCVAYTNDPNNDSLPSVKPDKITAVCKADSNMSPEEAKELYKPENLTEEQLAAIQIRNASKEEAIKREQIMLESSKKKFVYGYLGGLKNGELASIINEHKDTIKSLNDVPFTNGLAALAATTTLQEEIGKIRLLWNWPPVDLQGMNHWAPVQYLDMIDENHVLVAYRADFQEYRASYDVDIVNFYIVLEKETNDTFSIKHNLRGYYEYWGLHTTDLYFASKSQKSTAFLSVKIGDSCSDIAKIEPALCFIPTLDNEYRDWSIMKILVEDGMIKFTFDDDFKLTAMEFHPYGEIYSNDGTEIFNILRAEKPIELPRG